MTIYLCWRAWEPQSMKPDATRVSWKACKLPGESLLRSPCWEAKEGTAGCQQKQQQKEGWSHLLNKKRRQAGDLCLSGSPVARFCPLWVRVSTFQWTFSENALTDMPRSVSLSWFQISSSWLTQLLSRGRRGGGGLKDICRETWKLKRDLGRWGGGGDKGESGG